VEATAALQYVQFGGLPTDSIGPGALGTGALYFDHSGDAASRQVYLKTATVTWRPLLDRLSIQVGRMPFTSGAERPSGAPRLEAVKRQRLDSRLVGEFEWSLFQRSFDGVRVDWDTRALRVTATAFRPTQGGFEDAAGVSTSDMRIVSGVVTTAPGVLLPGVEAQAFVHHYDDRRRVTARPDNTGLTAAAADVGIATFGGHLVGTRRLGAGELDGLAWAAAQTGSWYELRHRAGAAAVEGGYGWPSAPWAPWLRAGVNWFSGDDSPGDDRHGTFFPMVPTVRRYAQSTLYSMANIRDLMVQLTVRPHPAVSVRVDGHWVSLSNPADGWYAGSGATQESGRIFGYTVRPSGDATQLTNVLEGSGEWRLTPRWSVNGYVGVASRGAVVRRSFAEGPAVFSYLENVLAF
jgi:hypothetical protein